MQWNTYLLWFGPALFLMLAAIGFGRYIRNRSRTASAGIEQLSAAEQERLAALLNEGNTR
jgi:cytochrome c-type biogenesis protein CcmH/NrfF